MYVLVCVFNFLARPVSRGHIFVVGVVLLFGSKS